MRITHLFKETSKQADYMRYDFNKYPVTNSIWSAYNNPSDAKISAYQHILDDYKTNNGLHAIQVGRYFKSLQYNNDMRVTGASSHFFSTIASFTDTETQEIYLIKETHYNTYACKLLKGGDINA